MIDRVIGLVGDVHGVYPAAVQAIRRLSERGAHELHFLGDFGFVWDDRRAERMALDELQRVLDAAGSRIFVTGGNHENYDLLLAIEPDAGGLRWIRPSIALLARGWRDTTPSGRVIASLGGANSIDRYSRKPGSSWWPREQIVDSDLAALGGEPVDILLGHDSPQTETLYLELLPNERMWSKPGLAYAHAGQAVFHRGFLAVRPKLAVGGHYHRHIDTTATFIGCGDEVFTSRIVVLADGGSHDPYLAVLDTQTLELNTLSER